MMFAIKEVLVVFSALAIIASSVRMMRSPDKMEVNIPNYSYERESGEYQDNMNQETAYWQGQGDKLGDREEQGHHQIQEDKDTNQENYDHEKEHHEEQQHNYNKEINGTYQEDRDKAETYHASNQEHYMHHHDNANGEIPSQTNKTAEELTETETGDRYGEKGQEYMEEGKDKMENYDVNGESPSISYTKS